MFFVFNKQKIISYLVAFSTVIILFCGASFFMPKLDDSILTSSNLKSLPIYSVNTNEKKVSLTINCAWNADDIDLILETLDKHKIKVTFFVVGDWVEKYQEAVKKIHLAGHEIGNHSDTHPHVTKLSLDENIKQIENCSNKVEKITGSKTTLYRGPYGEYNDTIIKAASHANHQAIQWSLDTLDYKGLTCEQMWERLDKKIENGSIILMHNGTKYTASSLDRIITNIKEKGYQIVKISDLIYKGSFEIDSNGVQKLIQKME